MSETHNCYLPQFHTGQPHECVLCHATTEYRHDDDEDVTVRLDDA